jgi:hypothetical protein
VRHKCLLWDGFFSVHKLCTEYLSIAVDQYDEYFNTVSLSTQDLCTETWPLRGAGSRQPEAPQQSPERAAAAPAPQLTMSLCFKIVFVAMVATIGAGAAQDAANSQPAQPAQPAQDQESYSLPGREDFEDAAQGEEQATMQTCCEKKTKSESF